MKCLYKYPQQAFPYAQLVEENRRRGRSEPEFELLDTGIFAEDRYFDVLVEYAKAAPEDILIQVTITNRGPASHTLHLLPTLWFRNTWGWNADVETPLIKVADDAELSVIEAVHPTLGSRWLYCEGGSDLLFTNSETNYNRPELKKNVACMETPGMGARRLLAIVYGSKLKRILQRMLDETEFFSPHGIRAISKYHQEHPYVLNCHGGDYYVHYEPAESTTGLFGGNSNWRGPVWFPVNYLIIEALWQFYQYFGDEFTVECPTGSGQEMTLKQVAIALSHRLVAVFEQDAAGRRPVYGGLALFQTDPHWRNHILFHEYFRGDNGAGLGASHQTGWTGLVAAMILQNAEHQTPRGDDGSP